MGDTGVLCLFVLPVRSAAAKSWRDRFCCTVFKLFYTNELSIILLLYDGWSCRSHIQTECRAGVC